MSPVGKHSGEQTRSDLPVRRIAVLALGVTLTVVAWGYLVKAAIDFGQTGRESGGSAWVFMVLSTLGAVACLIVAMILGARLLSTIQRRDGPDPPSAAPGSGGGRRIAR